MAADIPKNYSPALRAVDAHLLQEDISSGALLFEEVKERVDVADADVLATTSQPGAMKASVKSVNGSGKSKTFAAMVEAHEDKLEKGKLSSKPNADDFGLDVDYKPGTMISTSGI